ncbi:MAG: phage GP46 family protein [Bacilli bacterium]|nr:phage GP46 family protein [Bacilli bacterium]
MSEEFAGDVLLLDTENGGQISVINGLIMPDKRFTTSVFLSLFGGNNNDSGRVDNNKTWWGNRFNNTSEVEKLVSRFQSITKTLPLTVKNINLAQQAAKDDLSWMIQEGIADDITVDIKAVNKSKIELNVVVIKDGTLIDKGNWTLQWEGGE